MNKVIYTGLFLTLIVSGFSLPIEKHEITNPTSNHTCDNCKKLIGFISIEEKQFNKTITDIIVLVRDICSDIKGPSGEECVFILNNMEEVINWITKGLSPLKICESLGFCNNTMLSRPCITEL